MLWQSYPNPFNPIAFIKYDLPVETKVTLRIYNILGQVIETLKDEIEFPGQKLISWNAGNYASGVYFYRLEAISTSDPSRSFTQVKKMLLLK